MRSLLERGLAELREKIGNMGAMVGESIEKTIIALKEMNAGLALEVVGKDAAINDAEADIERRCLSLFALQQPLAGDLRAIGSSLKMITDLERIADHCADISELVERLATERPEIMDPRILDMAEMARSMVKRSIDAFMNHDVETARKICREDDEIDALFNVIIAGLADRIKEAPDKAVPAVDLMFIAKYFERMADHATNICEWAVYNQTGEHKHLQHPEDDADSETG